MLRLGLLAADTEPVVIAKTLIVNAIATIMDSTLFFISFSPVYCWSVNQNEYLIFKHACVSTKACICSVLFHYHVYLFEIVKISLDDNDVIFCQ